MHRSLAATLIVCALVAAPAAAAEKRSPDVPARPGEGSHMLSLALIVAGKDLKDGMQPLPPPVEKAVQDIKGFLPYTEYEMQDTAVVRGSNLTPIHVILEGPDARYEARLQYQLTEDPKKLNVFQFEMARVYVPGGPRPGSAAGAGEQPTPEPPSNRQVLSTAFQVNVGESIVVGTSRLNHTGKALVVILTVMPAGA
jgi:hypothetical protein